MLLLIADYCMLFLEIFNFMGGRILILIFLLDRYASLYFVVCVDKTDNELITLEIIHRFGLTTCVLSFSHFTKSSFWINISAMLPNLT